MRARKRANHRNSNVVHVAHGSRVTVLSRAGCHLCGQAQSAVRRICAELGVAWETVDVDGDPEMRAEYGDFVPVIFVDDAEHGYWWVEEDRLRAALGG